jgi:hypothetical protein
MWRNLVPAHRTLVPNYHTLFVVALIPLMWYNLSLTDFDIRPLKTTRSHLFNSIGHRASVAQWLERSPFVPWVPGPSPGLVISEIYFSSPYTVRRRGVDLQNLCLRTNVWVAASGVTNQLGALGHIRTWGPPRPLILLIKTKIITNC